MLFEFWYASSHNQNYTSNRYLIIYITTSWITFSLQDYILREFSNEDELMNEWEMKTSMTEDLLKVIVEVAKFCEVPATEVNYQDYVQVSV